VEKTGDHSAILRQTGEPVVVGRSEKMSKSKKNVVDPNEIIEQYGADTARWFVLSDSPPERDLEWTTKGVEGAWRFTQRLWRLVTNLIGHAAPFDAPQPDEINGAALDLRRATHKAVSGITKAIEDFHFNRAVAMIYEYANSVGDVKVSAAAQDLGLAFAIREALESLVVMINPMMPHLAEELWHALGHRNLVAEAAWPKADPALLQDDQVTIAVQVQGKLRDTLLAPKDADRDFIEREALALEKVQRAIEGRAVRKVIIVPNRIVNLVV